MKTCGHYRDGWNSNNSMLLHLLDRWKIINMKLVEYISSFPFVLFVGDVVLLDVFRKKS